MAITIDDFSKIWASTSPLTPYSFSEDNYKSGWNFIGSTPPSRQMWDFLQKQNDEKLKYLLDNFDDYLPLSGGTMSGTIVSNVSGVNIPAISMNTDDNICFIYGGSDRNKGARIGLNGKDLSTEGGFFTISADDGINTKQLQGKPDGTLTWDGNNVERVNASASGLNYIRYENGLQICWGVNYGSGTSSYKTVTFPVPFKDNVDIGISIVSGGTTSSASNHISFQVSDVSETSFGFLMSIATLWSDGTARWIAVGFWK